MKKETDILNIGSIIFQVVKLYFTLHLVLKELKNDVLFHKI